eukprot:m.27998 g.27998  ORF g.27998 m.27998 type:complete len:169 (-) comp10363_c0_seq2:278-784(-)
MVLFSVILACYHVMNDLTYLWLEQQGHWKRTAAHLAAKYGHDDCLELLQGSGADLTLGDEVGMTPLHLAVVYGRLNTVETLLGLGVDANVTNKMTGDTPLHLAAQAGYGDVSSALIDAGGDVTICNNNSQRPLSMHTSASTVSKRISKSSIHRFDSSMMETGGRSSLV